MPSDPVPYQPISDLKSNIQKEINTITDRTDAKVNTDLAKTLLYTALGSAAIGGGLAYANRGEVTTPPPVLESEEDKLLRLKKEQVLREAAANGIAPQQVKLAWDFSDAKELLSRRYDSVKNYLSGLYEDNSVATQGDESKMYYPIAATGILGGGYLGYKALGNYLDNRKKEEQIQEIKKRRKLLDTLVADNPRTPEIEKLAGSGANTAIGLYATMAGLLGLGGYMWGSDSGDDVKKNMAALKDAKNKWALQNNESTAVPSLNSIDSEGYDDSGEEEPTDNEGLPLVTSGVVSRPMLVDNINQTVDTDPNQSIVSDKQRELLKASHLLLQQ